MAERESPEDLVEKHFAALKRIIEKLDAVEELVKDLQARVSGVIEKRNEQRFR